MTIFVFKKKIAGILDLLFWAIRTTNFSLRNTHFFQLALVIKNIVSQFSQKSLQISNLQTKQDPFDVIKYRTLSVTKSY